MDPLSNSDMWSMATKDEHLLTLQHLLYDDRNVPCPFIDMCEVDSQGRSVLHIAASSGVSLGIAGCIVQFCQDQGLLLNTNVYGNHQKQKYRKQQKQNKQSVLRRLLNLQDEESGYTALHRAFLKRDFRMAWFLLRASYDDATNNNQLGQHEYFLSKVRDKDGLTAHQLMGQLMRPDLAYARAKLSQNTQLRRRLFPSGLSSASPMARLRAVSDVGYETDEDEDKYENNLPIDKNSPIEDNDILCEVLTFGISDHFALGSKDSGNMDAKPRRLETFSVGNSRKSESGTVIDVSTAQHHTLFLTQMGHVYACGLGRGGRLGAAGDCFIPRQVLGPLENRKVICIAAAENHSLAVTSEGHVYSWGSNRFGQLGWNLDPNASSSQGDNKFMPRRIDGLKCKAVKSVAAGARHSVALTQSGEIYTFGDNKSGQLGLIGSSTNGKVYRVEALWGGDQRKVGLSIAAGEDSTMALIAPFALSSTLNNIFEWGNGISNPHRVVLPDVREMRMINVTGRQTSNNPVNISCGRYHKTAVTADGKVYSWGTSNSDILGLKNSNGSNFTRVSSPQLITALLPENIASSVVSISASEDHTAAVTDTGDLYTWGAAAEKGSLGHKGVKWQPSPKRVNGAQRVVKVSVAKTHSVILTATSFPKIQESPHPVSLEVRCEEVVANCADIYNVLPLLLQSERIYAHGLTLYCSRLIQANMDAFLSFTKKKELSMLLNDAICKVSHDVKAIYPEAKQDEKSDPGFFEASPSRKAIVSFKIQNLIKTIDYDNAEKLVSRRNLVYKELRGLSKKLKTIGDLIDRDSIGLTQDQREKVARKACIEADIEVLRPLLEKIEERMVHFNLAAKEETAKSKTPELLSDSVRIQEFSCSVCGVKCPDRNSLTLHLNGRRHHNRVKQLEEEEKSKVAESLRKKKEQEMQSQRKPQYSSESLSTICPKAPVKSLADIMQEEQEASIKVSRPRSGSFSASKLNSSPLKINVSSSAPNSFTLGAMMTPKQVKTPPSQRSRSGSESSPWATSIKKPISANANNNDNANKKSFEDILKEEAEIKSTQEFTAEGTRWFIGRRQRADSMAAIQRAEEEEKRMQDLIMEQKAIEKQIQKDQELKKRATNAKSKPKQNKNGKNATAKKSRDTEQRPKAGTQETKGMAGGSIRKGSKYYNRSNRGVKKQAHTKENDGSGQT